MDRATWLAAAGFTIPAEAAGDDYHHVIARKGAQ